MPPAAPPAQPLPPAGSARSGIWMLLAQAARFVTGTLTLVVLARHLGPAPFGVLAMAEIVTAVVLTVGGFGFHLAVVQRPTLSDPALARLFRVNLLLSAALWAVVCVSGPLLAWLFGRNELVAVAAALGLGVFLDNAAALHWGLAQRKMHFGRLALTETLSVVAGCGVALVLAAAGAGVWALVGQQLVTLSLRSALLVWSSGAWWPVATPTHAGDPEYRAMLGYGGKHTAGRIVKTLAGRVDRLLVGRFAGAPALGLYDNAARWAQLPALQILSPLASVATAGASRLIDQPAAYRAYLRRALGATLAFTLPALLWMSVAAEPVVHLVLGPGWRDAAPLLRWLTLGVAASTPLLALKVVLYAEGRLTHALHINLISAGLQIAGVVLGARHGVIGIAVGAASGKALATLFLTRYALQTSAFTPRDFLRVFTGPLLAALAAAAALHYLQPLLPGLPHPLLACPVSLAIFAVLYATFTLLRPSARGDLRWAWRHRPARRR